MLKKIRVALGVACLAAALLLFIDFTGTARHYWGWLAQVQVIPALLSVNFIAIAFLVVLALLFGRAYCSVICPLGVLQDAVIWLRGHIGPKKRRINRFKYHDEMRKLRLSVLTLFLVFTILGLVSVLAAVIAGLLDPYSAFGRIASQIFAPAYNAINNVFADYAEAHDSYVFYRVATYVSIPVLVVAIITLVIVTVMAWTSGRGYCNKICPVGTLLGFLSKFSMFKISIDTDKCNRCGKCGRNCKSECIDTKNHIIDYSRCVVCMDCIGNCSQSAISYRFNPKGNTETKSKNKSEENESDIKGRRTFIATLGFIAGAAGTSALAKVTDGGFTKLKDKTPIKRKRHIVPPGAISHSHLSRHCTACQLCIQACPEKIIKPSKDISRFMQPEIDFTQGFCRPECTKCSNICPVGAFHPINPEDKSSIKIGSAVVDYDRCISASAGQICNNCERHCPTAAITMTTNNDGHNMPVVNDSICIGCGECEFHCPVGSVATMLSKSSAIHIDGLDVHRTI